MAHLCACRCIGPTSTAARSRSPFWNSTGASAASAGWRRAPDRDAVTAENPAPMTARTDARSELVLRILSAAVLAPLAVFTAFLGGVPLRRFLGAPPFPLILGVSQVIAAPTPI